MNNNSNPVIDRNELCIKLYKIKADGLLLIKEVAKFLKVSRRTVQRRCHDGDLIFVKVKRAVRITVEALLNYIETHTVVNG